jgi:hypothetical protein
VDRQGGRFLFFPLSAKKGGLKMSVKIARFLLNVFKFFVERFKIHFSKCVSASENNRVFATVLNFACATAILMLPILIVLSGIRALVWVVVYSAEIQQFIIQIAILIGGAIAFWLWLDKKLAPPVFPVYPPEQYFFALGEYMLELLAYFCNPDAKYHKIKDFEDVADWSRWNDGNFFIYIISKVEPSPIDDEELKMFRYKVESRINNKLKNMAACIIPSFDNLPPEIFVADIIDKGGRLEIFVFLANCPTSRQKLAIYRQQTKKQTPTLTTDKSDNGLYSIDPNSEEIILHVGLNAEMFRLGNKEFAEINLTKSPHLAVVANTGGGKSYLLKQLIALAAMYKGCQIWLADYKNGGDYGDFDRRKHRYYTRDNYFKAITDFEIVVNDRIEKRDMGRDLRVLVLEEYGAFLNSLDKKEGDSIKKAVASLLFMARSANCFVFVCSQRLFAEQMIFGSRDMLTNVILLADPSSESLRAFCSSDEIAEMKPHQQGEGYLVREGKKPLEIIVCKIENPEMVQSSILRAVTKDISEIEQEYLQE